MSPPKNHPRRPSAPLLKQKSWSPDSYREELWLRRKEQSGPRRSKSLTDEDFDELKACFELGFGFNPPELGPDQRLSDTLPALGFYLAVNKSYNDTVLKSNKSSSSSLSLLGTASSSESDLSLSSPVGSPLSIICPGDDPKTIKTRLRHWAQAVACSVKQW
ncbi:hypothetical protein SOVF_205180 [Spinacia oleracea]|uniref:Uncharacterized protein n=1 Tax=Spinacia oleracea TaxID=3562 RepID=A0A9R0HUP0_SPIOL|nr:uncharacterized protein LOC110777085 [Spinacia oleracea]KNA03857.1 hypothetical protein SOVF_205180 [Spinacia oleracea]